MIILNEKKYVEEFLNNKEMITKPSLMLLLLSKYYRYEKNMEDKDIKVELNKIMEKRYLEYNDDKFQQAIDRSISKSKKLKFNCYDHINITKYELNFIKMLNNDKQEMIVFTMLCFAKANNLLNPRNNNWVSCSLSELLKSSRVPNSKNYDNKLYINDAKDRFIINTSINTNIISSDGEVIRENFESYEINKTWITLSDKTESTNICVNFIDDNDPSDVLLNISDFRELGYQYLQWKQSQDDYTGEANTFRKCKKCGRLFKVNNKNKEYCSKKCYKLNNEYQKQEVKTVICVDCGLELEINACDMKTCRCKKCQHEKDKERKRIWKQNNKK